MLSRKLSREEEKQHADLAQEVDADLAQELAQEQHADVEQQAAKTKELDAWKKCDAFEPRNDCDVSEDVQTRCVPASRMADGHKDVKARLVAKGYQDPDLQVGNVDTSGRVSLRSSCLQVILLRAIKKCKLCSLDTKDALLQPDGSIRDVFLYASPGWEPSREKQTWKLKAPAYGLDGAPAAFHRSIKQHLLNSEEPIKKRD